MKNAIWLRYISLLEGTSWLLLLFVAMPLKYMAGNPLPVKFVGMGHGVLFIALVAFIMMALDNRVISKKLGIKVFIASLIPFGSFIIDKQINEALKESGCLEKI